MGHAIIDQQRISRLEQEIMWLKSSVVTIMTLVKSERPPTYKQIEDVCQRTLEKFLEK